jgi:hypothetical protein
MSVTGDQGVAVPGVMYGREPRWKAAPVNWLGKSMTFV